MAHRARFELASPSSHSWRLTPSGRKRFPSRRRATLAIFGMRRGGGGRRNRSTFVTEVSTMVVIGLVLSVVGIGFFCWLLFTLAVYALPFFASVTSGFGAFNSGAGVIGAIVVGIVAGAVTLCAGQLAFAVAGSPLIRAAIALLFATP